MGSRLARSGSGSGSGSGSEGAFYWFSFCASPPPVLPPDAHSCLLPPSSHKKHSSTAGLKLSDLNEVIMVGGSTRIPAVQELVKKLAGKVRTEREEE